jgi:hypothetical protein
VRPARRRLSRAASTGMLGAFAASPAFGATAIVVQYRIFQGPDTHQLPLVWVFSMPFVGLVLWLPAVLLGGATGHAVARRPSGAVAVVTVIAVIAFAITYGAIGWGCDRLGWGRDWFEMSDSLGIAGAVTGAATALVVVHALRDAGREPRASTAA